MHLPLSQVCASPWDGAGCSQTLYHFLRQRADRNPEPHTVVAAVCYCMFLAVVQQPVIYCVTVRVGWQAGVHGAWSAITAIISISIITMRMPKKHNLIKHSATTGSPSNFNVVQTHHTLLPPSLLTYMCIPHLKAWDPHSVRETLSNQVWLLAIPCGV